MSIEYTLDIQLTELGFPDILQSQQTPVREPPCRSTSPDDSLSPSHSPTSLSTTHKQRRLIRGGEEAGVVRQTSRTKQTAVVSGSSPLPEALPCERLNPTQSPQDGQAVNGAQPSEPAAGPETTGIPRMISGQVAGEDAAQEDLAEAQQDEEDDSDDSEVSEVYEEEEVDEDDEEEEGLTNESSHSGDHRCTVCDLQLPSKFKLQDHMNLHTGARPYCCAECGKRFCQIYNYRVHLRTHAQAKVDRLVCRVCLMGFASQQDLNQHLSKTHLEDKFYECDRCKRVFTSLKACEYHVQLHKCMQNVVCDGCGRNFSSPKSLVRHRRKSCCYGNFKCTDCTKTFSKKNALLKHSFSHLGLLPYTCIRCRCHFRLAKLYRQHKCEPERIHCVACLREFLSQEDFQQHKKDTGCWGNQEPNETTDEIRCLECGQRFETSEELKKHAGAHQRVLKCAECGKGFRSALLLMSHMGGHAGQSPCLCQSCGLGFPHQQNYDSHLKTCGQTPQPASAPKKRQTMKSSLPETKKVNAKPDLPNTKSTVTVPPVVLNNPAAPVKDRRSPGPLTEGVSAGSGPSDGLWKLTLDKKPPPGVKLVVFLPVCPTQTNGLPLPSAVPQTLSVPAMQALPQAASPPFISNGCFGGNAAFGVPLNTPLDLFTGNKGDPEEPLDLSKKCDSSKSAKTDIPLLPIKSEPEELEISGQANGTERQQVNNYDSKMIVKTDTGLTDTATEVKQGKMDPRLLSPPKAKAEHTRLIVDIKEEPQSPGSAVDLRSSKSSQLRDRRPEKEVKMEVDVSGPACADMEK